LAKTESKELVILGEPTRRRRLGNCSTQRTNSEGYSAEVIWAKTAAGACIREHGEKPLGLTLDQAMDAIPQV
jgi:hypothetical protein